MRPIQVEEVRRVNTGSGRQTITILGSAENSIFRDHYRVSDQWMPYGRKLAIAAVQRGDCAFVQDIPKRESEWSQYHGEVVDVHTRDGGFREAMCACGASLISDGFHIVCPNPRCFLSVSTRLTELTKIEMFSYKDALYNPTVATHFGSTHPFDLLNDPGLWEAHGSGSLDFFMVSQGRATIDIDTFLIEECFGNFLDYLCPHPSAITHDRMDGITRFYQMMRVIATQRTPSDPAQNRVIKGVFKALCIDGLTEAFVDKLIQYELASGVFEDIWLLYIYLIYNPMELERCVGVPRLFGEAVKTDFHRNRHAYGDIFREYLSPTAVLDFNRLVGV